MDNEAIQKHIENFIKLLGVTFDSIELDTVGTNQVFNIQTKESKKLIGLHGDNLRAVNYILRRQIEKMTGSRDQHFMVDVNGYQLTHIRELEQKAKLLADRVRTFRSSAEMTPMSAYERMIVHSLFSDDKEIATESDGMGKARHVVLKYKTPSEQTEI